MGRQRPPAKQDSRDSRIRKQEQEVARLREELVRVERERDRWKRDSDRWKRRSDLLKKQLDAARRAGFRQAAPFAKDRPQGCGRRPGAHYGRQACRRLQTSDALGAASVQVGPATVALAVELHTKLGVPLAKVAHLLRTRFSIRSTRGGLVGMLHRTAQHAAPSYAALREQVRSSPVVTPDETGWRVGADRHWLWTFATPLTTVYAIRPTRSFDEAAAILGADFSGVLVRDGWVPYRRFTAPQHQSCLAHLLRRSAQLRADHPYSRWADEVHAVLQAALALRDRRDQGRLSGHGLATARGRLRARLTRLIDNPSWLDDSRRFAAHLDRELPAVFTFLEQPGVDATNWRTEQAIRPAVVIRKVCGGNRTRHGADTRQVLASVVRTAHQRHLDLATLIVTLAVGSVWNHDR